MTRFSLDNTKHFLERQENISVETRQAILEAIKKYNFSCVIDDLNLIKNNIRLLLNQVIANLGIDLNFNLNLFVSSGLLFSQNLNSLLLLLSSKFDIFC